MLVSVFLLLLLPSVADLILFPHLVVFFLCFAIPQQTVISDKFAKLSEALYIADRNAREELEQRNRIITKMKEKEKSKKEEEMRELARKTREERFCSLLMFSTASSLIVVLLGGGTQSWPCNALGNRRQTTVACNARVLLTCHLLTCCFCFRSQCHR